MFRGFAHILAADSALSWWLLVAAALALVLVVQHHVVAGFGRDVVAHRLKLVVGISVIAAIIAVAAPAQGAQPTDAVLPDLISDAPRPSFFNELRSDDRSTRLVLTFDGYVHNIGDGPLDVVGNPQLGDGMRQRVRVGDDWEEVGSPTVRYETDDGHNHFHLIEAIEYVLWNELQGVQSAIGSKIGFCLVDSEQIEAGFDQAYTEELDNFCQEDNPEADSLRMGISPGWRDIYDATTTLQWVDVSDVTPGRYWIGAITDPNNEIVESNEDNNDLIFSDTTVTVPGYLPRPMDAIEVEGAGQQIELASVTHGQVGAPVYVIEQGPTSGRLDVPVGVDLTTNQVRYVPDPGFEGRDQITFSVRDATSPYPLAVTSTQTVDLVVSGASDTADTGDTSEFPEIGLAPAVGAASTFVESTFGERISFPLQVSDAIGGPARAFATGLPTGLTLDAQTGIVSGVVLEEGVFETQFTAVAAEADGPTTLDVTWIVNQQSTESGLLQIQDLSSPRDGLSRIRVGVGLDLSLEVDGLPPGVELEESAAAVSGAPSQVGSFDVTVRQLSNGEVLDETSFTWTVRPTTAISFTL